VLDGGLPAEENGMRSGSGLLRGVLRFQRASQSRHRPLLLYIPSTHVGWDAVRRRWSQETEEAVAYARA
jgi:hypothetical protein